MRILYGVQGTGNGHITRARALNSHFEAANIQADFLFSGRPKDKFFDMEEFGDNWRCRRGLTFVHEAGQLKFRRTIQQNSVKTLVKDIAQLDLSPYDLVITDFEPITAWSAKRQNKPCLGVGHQYAFNHDVPKMGDTLLPKSIMRYFAPTEFSLGLHWHHFGAPILPPIAETQPVDQNNVERDKIVVYLGFEEPEEVIQFLEPFNDHLFVYYGPFPQYESRGNIQLKPLSREGFHRDLVACNGVISNAGFELASESIQLGKKLLVKPLMGQMEQLSNAKALEELNLGMTMTSLDRSKLRLWLDDFESKRVIYPNVAKAIVEWVAAGDWHNSKPLVESLWSQVHVDSGQADGLLSCINQPPLKAA